MLPPTVVIEGPGDVDNDYSPAVAEPDDEVVHVIPNSEIQPSIRWELAEPELGPSPVAEFTQA